MPARQKVVIYHNPRCTKSRETLALLKEHGVEPEVREYLKSPPTAAEVEELIGCLGVAPLDLVRRREAAFTDAGLTAASSASDVAKTIAAQPILLERPVVRVGAKAAIGRPPAKVLALL